MREGLNLPNIPEYVSIKDAAKILGVSDKRVYAYIEEGRLPAMRAAHVIMIPLEEVKKFKPKISGRPRKNTPLWRTSPNDNLQLTTSIFVRAKGNQKQVRQTLEEMKQDQEHLFPGTIARYVIESATHPQAVEILLVWRSTVMPNEREREHLLEAFRQVTSEIFAWETAQYDQGQAFLHT